MWIADVFSKYADIATMSGSCASEERASGTMAGGSIARQNPSNRAQRAAVSHDAIGRRSARRPQSPATTMDGSDEAVSKAPPAASCIAVHRVDGGDHEASCGFGRSATATIAGSKPRGNSDTNCLIDAKRMLMSIILRGGRRRAVTSAPAPPASSDAKHPHHRDVGNRCAAPVRTMHYGAANDLRDDGHHRKSGPRR